MITDKFKMNDYVWLVEFVDAHSPELIDREGVLRVATTNPVTHVVSLSDQLRGSHLMQVLIHEMGHCALVSYDLLRELHPMVAPEHWIDVEEFICNLLADYGWSIYQKAFKMFGYDAWKLVPEAFEQYIA